MRSAANPASHHLASHANDPRNQIADAQDIAPSLKSWIDENLKEPNQRIFDLWHGPNDYIVRVVMDTNVVAVQPANITFKVTIGDVGTSKQALKALNFTVRHESSSVKMSTGTKLQFGYDVTKSDKNKRADYSQNNEPIMDLISIEALGEGAIDRLRTEFKWEKGQPLSPTAVMQEALSLGGNIRWRRVWEDPKTGEKSGIDVMLTMKTEASANLGVGKTNGWDAKAELEASVRFIGGISNKLDIHQLEDLASKALAKFIVPLHDKRSDPHVTPLTPLTPKLNAGTGQPSQSLATLSSTPADFIKQGWVGCETTHKQLIYGTIGRDGPVQVRNDAGKVLATYDAGTTKDQIAWTMANANSLLYNQGAYLAPKTSAQYQIDSSSRQGKYRNGDTVDDLPGGHDMSYFETLPGQGPAGGARNVKNRTNTYAIPDWVGPGKDDVRAWVIRSINMGFISFPDVALGGASKADAMPIKQGWVGCETTHKQLIMFVDGRTGMVTMTDDGGTVYGTYAQGTTKQQIADTMANPKSSLYMKGSDLRIAMNTESVSKSAASRNSAQSGRSQGLIATINTVTNKVLILHNNQLVAELRPGASLDNARELIAIGTFNHLNPEHAARIPYAAIQTTTPDSVIGKPRIRMA
jgi:hypothetical protein